MMYEMPSHVICIHSSSNSQRVKILQRVGDTAEDLRYFTARWSMFLFFWNMMLHHISEEEKPTLA